MSSTSSRMSIADRRPDLAPPGRSTWVISPVTTIFDPKPKPGEEHLHLLGGGVLRLVEDDERVIERPTAHVCQRRYLDDPGGHQLRDQLGVHHLVQRVIQRAQIRVDLLAQRARQKPKALTGFHGGTGQDDAGHLLGLQRVDRLGHGQIRLAGTGRPDPEDDGVGVDGVDVALLVERLGPDRLAAARQDVQGEHLGRRLVAGADQHGDAVAHHLRRQRLAAGHDGDQLGDHPLGERDVGRFAREGDGIAAHMQVGAQYPFEGAQILVCRTQQAHDEIRRNVDAAANLSVGLQGPSCVSSAGLAWRHVVSDACLLGSSGCSSDVSVYAGGSVWSAASGVDRPDLAASDSHRGVSTPSAPSATAARGRGPQHLRAQPDRDRARLASTRRAHPARYRLPDRPRVAASLLARQRYPRAGRSPTRARPVQPRRRPLRRGSAGSAPPWTTRRRRAGCAPAAIAGPPTGPRHATGADPCRPGRLPSWPRSGPPARPQTRRRRPRWPIRSPTPSARTWAALAPPSPAAARARRSSDPAPGHASPSRPACSTTQRARPPAPSPSTNCSPGRIRRTVAAWNPSSPSTTASPPMSGSAST